MTLLKEGKVKMSLEPGPSPPGIKVSKTTGGESVILTDKTEIKMENDALTIRQKSWLNPEAKCDVSNIGWVVIDYCQSSKKWAWSVVIIEKGTFTRHEFAHNLPGEMLTWLQRYLLSEILKS
ncbi:MAG: hypothetical protein GY757_05465 [bacterium]|nr:hypothetical protein [bacterium]